MKERKIIKSGYYHIYNRGSKKVFLYGDAWDCLRFLRISTTSLQKYGNKVVAYCLMGNHYHFILKVKNKVSLSRSMHELGIKYACYYNNKYNISGHVFQGRYQSKHVNTPTYLIYLSRYLHRNPLEIKSSLDLSLLESYRWSSFRKYAGISRRSDIKIQDKDLMKYFVNQKEYKEFCLASEDAIRTWVSDLVTRPGPP